MTRTPEEVFAAHAAALASGDISTTLDRKIAALSEHRSQIRDLDALGDRIRAWAAEEGQSIGVSAAESLRLVIIDDDEDEGPSAVAETPADPPGEP